MEPKYIRVIICQYLCTAIIIRYIIKNQVTNENMFLRKFGDSILEDNNVSWACKKKNC